MIKCPKCGENIQLTWQYCPNCGLNVTQHFKSGAALCDAAKELEEEGKFQEAARLYALAAGHEKKPSAEAMYRLGILYESGPESVRRGEDDIGYCFKSAAEMGYKPALEWLRRNGYIDEEEGEDNDLDLGRHVLKKDDGNLKKVPFPKTYVGAQNEERSYGNRFAYEEEHLKNTQEANMCRLLEMGYEVDKYYDIQNGLFRDIGDYRDDRGDFVRKMRHVGGKISDAEEEARVLQRRLPAPYTARFLLTDDSSGEKLDLYIGHDHLNLPKALIVGWNEPICAWFKKPDTEFVFKGTRYSVMLRRDIYIRDGKLERITDMYNRQTGDAVSYDAFLKEVLERRKDQAQVEDIINSIQNNQSSIITLPRNKNFIVQGCAGSGKSMIMLYHLEHLRLEKALNPERVTVLVPSERYKEQIRKLVVELGIDRLSIETPAEFYRRALGKYSARKLPQETLDDVTDQARADYYYSDEFYRKAAEMCGQAISEYETKVQEHQLYLRNKKRRDELNSYGELDQSEKEELRALKVELKQVRRMSAPRKPRANLSKKFKSISYEGKGVQKTGMLRAELYATLLLNYLMYGRAAEKNAAQLICVDEGQDLTRNEYLLINNLYRLAYFNVFGDIRQRLECGTGLHSWQDLAAVGDFDFYELNENYRNTEEITDFINKRMHMSMQALGLPGDKVTERNISDHLQLVSRLDASKRNAYIIADERADMKGYSAEKLPSWLPVLTVTECKGLEFNGVIVDDRKMTENEKYIAYSRALEKLYLVV